MFRFAASHRLQRCNAVKVKSGSDKAKSRNRQGESRGIVSSDSFSCSREEKKKKHYRLVVMGAAAVGKSSIISQFLYDRFLSEYQETVEDMHRGEFCQNGTQLTLDILDTAGAHSFPAMRKLAISTADAFVLVYSLEDDASFEAVKELRDQILQERGDDVPIVVVGNKADISQDKRFMVREVAEAIVCVDWGNGYVEASAKDGINVAGVFKEILRQSQDAFDVTCPLELRRPSLPSNTPRKKIRVLRALRSGNSS